jgi:hypothetical protein
MIIGRFSNDENPVEEVDLSNKGRMFELEVCIVKHPHRYPRYQVDYCSLAFCQSKDSAEKIMRDVLQSKSEWIKDIYCFNLYERALDVMFDRSEYMSCWLYDKNGTMIDKRTFPSYWSEGRFVGRSEDEIRFKFGDLVELYNGDTVSLVYVLAPPREKEWYIKKTEENGEPYFGDISDDTYIVIDGPTYMGHHMHVDALSLFEPHFAIPKNVARKFEKIWEGYLEDRRECYGDNPTIHQI